MGFRLKELDHLRGVAFKSNGLIPSAFLIASRGNQKHSDQKESRCGPELRGVLHGKPPEGTIRQQNGVKRSRMEQKIRADYKPPAWEKNEESGRGATVDPCSPVRIGRRGGWRARAAFFNFPPPEVSIAARPARLSPPVIFRWSPQHVSLLLALPFPPTAFFIICF